MTAIPLHKACLCPCKMEFPTHLHEVGLGLIHASHVVKSDASVGLHLEFGLRLPKVERVVAAGAAHAAALATGQQEQAANQQQGEGQVACRQGTNGVLKMHRAQSVSL